MTVDPAEVADQQLRRFVVRIETPDGAASLGTGVLVAPGWALTCAHVVEGLDTVCVVPDRGAAPESAAPESAAPAGAVPHRVRAWVRSRSGDRDASSASAFWPFPDLALLELDGWTRHVCAPLTTDEPVRASEPHAWGFGRREQGVVAVGSAASFRYVGLDGDGYLQLQAGDAPPGLSGAPLVCPQRRAVVGLMSVSRDPSDARGGWASPVSALAGGPGVPEELARLGHQVLVQGREAAWRHRNAWHSVLPIPGAGSLADRPWDGAEVDPASAQPSAMLRAEFRVVPYRFRDAELTDVLAWCDGKVRLAVSYLDAPGGAGKTRFAIEACRAAQARGWVAGLLPQRNRGGDELPLPRLFVVDYVEERRSRPGGAVVGAGAFGESTCTGMADAARSVSNSGTYWAQPSSGHCAQPATPPHRAPPASSTGTLAKPIRSDKHSRSQVLDNQRGQMLYPFYVKV